MRIKIITFIIVLSTVLTSCTTTLRNSDSVKEIELNDMEYIISFSGSNRYKYENSITVLYNDGRINEYKLNSSMAIENGMNTEEGYKFYSRQADVHYDIINGELEKFNLLDNEMTGGYYGVLSASTRDNIDMQIVNCGTTENGYLTKLIITNEEEKKVYDFYEKLLCNAIREDNFIIISYIDLTSNYKDENSIGISKLAILDLEEEEIVLEFELPTKFRVEPDVKMLYIDSNNGDIIIFSNKLNEKGEFDGESYVGVYSIKENKLEKTVTMENVNIAQIYEYGSQIVILETNGKISINDTDMVEQTTNIIELEGEIRKTYQKENIIYIATIDEDNDITIIEYDINVGESVKKTNIPKPTTIEWNNENFDFLPTIEKFD